MDTERLNNSPQKVIQTLINFCDINDIKKSNADEVAAWLIANKGRLYLNTLEKTLSNFTSGEYDMKKPYQLNAHFVSQCVSYYMKQAGASHEYVDKPIEPNPIEIKKQTLFTFAESIGETRESAYGYLVRNPATDTMSYEQILQGYKQYMIDRT